MKNHEFAKLNSGHQKFLKALWEQQRKKLAYAKGSNPDRQINQPVPTASVTAAPKPNLK